MQSQESAEELVKIIAKMQGVGDVRILLREIQVILRGNLELGIKTYLTHNAGMNEQYSYEVSHYVKGPKQASPYTPTHTTATSELELIRRAIADALRYINWGIQEGDEPDDSWLIANTTY